MEFELERTQLSGFKALLDTTLLREETLEMIVPDACPDILRVVETDGKVLLRSKDAMDGKVELSGTIQAAVLYLPDGEEGLRHLDVAIPFTCAVDGKDVGPSCTVVASAWFVRADTRTVNPRKILVRAEAAVSLTVFAPQSEVVCGQVMGEMADQVEQLTETRELYLTACVQEKPFSCTDDIPISASKPPVAELLKSRVTLTRGESKIIGSKLIFKGSANVNLVYRGEDGSVCTAGAETPFSQIMEILGVGEEAECDLTLALSGADCTLDPGGDGRTVSINLQLLAQAVVRESRVVDVLTDAYATKLFLSAEWASCPVENRQDRGVRSQNVREAWEVPGTIQEISDCRLVVGQVLQSREGERLVLNAQGEIQVLYRGEEGALYFTSHPVTVPCVLELPEDCQCFCQCEGVGDVYAAPAAGNIEVRFTVDFRYCAIAHQTLTTVSMLQPGEPPENVGEQPSLVLRMLEKDERLWDVAKAYSTTIRDIISANELDGEAAAAGRLLLIPRGR